MRSPSPFVRGTSALAATALLMASLVSAQATAAEPRLVVADATAVPLNATVLSGAHEAHFDLVLASKNVAGEDAFLRAVSTPTSELYRHFLTPAGFAARFGAPSSAVVAVRSALTASGLTPGVLSAGGNVLHVSGSTTAIAHLFHASVATISTLQGVSSQLTTNATLPSSIAHDVVAVAGLSPVAFTSNVAHARAAHVAAPAGSCPSAGPTTGVTPNNNGYSVQQQGNLYGLTSLWNSGDLGQGATIALYELGAVDTQDLTFYESCYGVSPTVNTYNVDGGATGLASEEATVDVEEVAALAPAATIDIYSGPNSASAPIDVFSRIADDNTATVVSTSWGDCENDPSGNFTAEQPIFQQMAAEGITVVSAAGDSGSSDCNGVTNKAPAVDDPASQPWVTGVGGTTVSKISPLTQTVWNTGTGAGGGGISDLWSRPWWQQGSLFNGDTSQGVATATGRMVPDVSAMANPADGFIEYCAGIVESGGAHPTTCQGWAGVGGTSIGAPIIATMAALATTKCSVSRLGLLNPTLYALAAAHTGFVDVTTGNNDTQGLANNTYTAGVGYDLASGLGTPNAQFVGDLCPSPPDSGTTTLDMNANIKTKVATPITITVRNANGTPLANIPVIITAQGYNGLPTFNGLSSTSAGEGMATVNATTSASGTVNVSFSTTMAGLITVSVAYQGQTLTSTLVTVTAPPVTTVPPNTPSPLAKTVGISTAQLSVTDVGSLGVPVSWQVSLNGGKTFTTYSAKLATVRLSALLRAHAYSVIVRAVNSYGASPWSAPVHIRTLV